MLRGAILIAVALSALGVRAGMAEPASTDLNAAVTSVCRPTFIKDGAPSLSGTGFILHAPAFAKGDVLVSVHHLFEMATATTRGMPWRDTPRRVTGATCESFDHSRTWRAAAAVAIPGVYAFWRIPGVKDVALLPVTSGPATTLDLSPTPAKPGDTVWVLAQVQHPSAADTLVHRARVIPSQGFLAFVYDGPPFDTSNISGAPIVDANGKVVGVNVGAGRSPDGVQLGVGDDLATLQAALQATTARR